MRLNKYIAQCGVCSRRKADEMISEGRVTINNERVLEHGTQVTSDDLITVDGSRISLEESVEYYLLRKPKSVITSSKDEQGRETVLDYIKSDVRLYPVGRLDFQTSGVLLLTNDGELCNKLSHPSFSINKVYDVRPNRVLTEVELKQLRTGVKIDGKMTHPCEVEVTAPNKSFTIRMTIHEGRNRQIRKMIETLGAKVRKLDRVSYAGLTYKGLVSGQYRDLTKKEVSQLQRLQKS